MRAIAAEDGVKEVMNSRFLREHKLGSASTVRSVVQALLDKELLFEDNGIYYVYDRFFSLWLANL